MLRFSLFLCLILLCFYTKLRGQVTEQEVFCVKDGEFDLGIIFSRKGKESKKQGYKETEVSLEVENLGLTIFH